MVDAVERFTVDGVTLVGSRDADIAFGFTERTGGVSKPPYASLNLGSHVGDDFEAVQHNRLLALRALGVENLYNALIIPNQVHGDDVVAVRNSDAGYLESIRERVAQGADAIVCTARHVPVMLCFADCVPVILTCGNNGFAVVHSGWKGTYARIAAKAARALCEETGADPSAISAYIGPHIQGDEYQVSDDLMHKFSLQFDTIAETASRLLDLSACIRQSLEEIGVPPCAIHDLRLSTVRLNDRFFSYRAENGTCGRHAAIAVAL